MTLCIGALCRDDEAHGRRPCVALCFDKRVETLTAGADIEFKYEMLSSKWGALLAGDISLARELTASYKELFSKTQDFPPSEVLKSLREPINVLRQDLADRFVRKKLAMTLEELKTRGQGYLPEDVFRQTWYEIAAQDIGVELILFGWQEKEFRLFKLSFGSLFKSEPFAVIGSGTDIAEPVLYQREYGASWSLPRALYAVYEAQRLGSIAPGVSKNPDKINTAIIYFNAELDSIAPRVMREVGRTWVKDRYDELGPKQISDQLSLPDNTFIDFGDLMAKQRRERIANESSGQTIAQNGGQPSQVV